MKKKSNWGRIDWYTMLTELGLVCIAGVWINSINALQNGFSWAGLGVMMSGVLLVIVFLILRNWRDIK